MRARFGDFVLDTETRQLLLGGEDRHLTPKALALLEYLVERRPRALAKSQILERVWPSTFVSESNLASLVKEIRRALGDDPKSPRCVRTVRGHGYAFVAETQIEGPSASDPRARAGTEFRVFWDRREIVLCAGENVLGRGHEAAVWVDHGSVSRRHALIRVHAGAAILEDCASKNGTFLRGHRLTGAKQLCDGDEILLGRARLLFRAYGEESSTATDPPED